jgi:hypothetical protein
MLVQRFAHLFLPSEARSSLLMVVLRVAKTLDAQADTKKKLGAREIQAKEAALTRESMAYGILYNNALFLLVTVIGAFYLFHAASPI